MNLVTIYAKKYEKLLPSLPERARRLVVGSDAKMLGRGGITIIHKASGITRKTIWKGKQKVAEETSLPANRSRKNGGGRKKVTEINKTLETDLLALVEDTSQGDLESPLKWTNISLRNLSTELTRKNHAVSHTQTGHILKAIDYRLPGNKKNKEGTDHPDQDAQFKHIMDRSETCIKPFSIKEKPLSDTCSALVSRNRAKPPRNKPIIMSPFATLRLGVRRI